MSETPKVIQELRKLRESHTYFQLSQWLGLPEATIQRWIKTGKMNRVYEQMVALKLKDGFTRR